MDSEIDVPPFFLCPISLEIMRDPVTVTTGITYDRESIEKWLFSGKNNTCPVTKQNLYDSDLTPNHTLRRLIQAWCTVNAVERIPTPKPPVNRSEIAKLLRSSNQSKSASLRRLKSIAAESDSNRRSLQSSVVTEFLSSIVISGEISDREEALSVLHSLRLSESTIRSTTKGKESEFVSSIITIMSSGGLESRAHGVIFLKSMFEAGSHPEMTCLSPNFFSAVTNLIGDTSAPAQASKSALQLLIAACPYGRNRVKAVEAGAVSVLVEILLECSDYSSSSSHAPENRRRVEMALAALESACGCAEGRSALVSHAAGLAAVSKKVLRVSGAASERAVRVILAVARHAPAPAVVAEMAAVGVVAKMCLVLQVECGSKIKEKAREVLRIHARSWRNSPCLPKHFLSSYPNN